MTLQPLRREIGEIVLNDGDFTLLVKIVKEHTGIVIGDNKRQMLYARLAKRLRKMGMTSFHQYIDLLNGPEGGDELGHCLNAVTTNLTKFFREIHHFEHLEQVALPEICAKRAATGRKLRIWSAGSSSGEEPYTLAMVLQSAVPDLARWDAKILASDIDTDMVRRGAEGIYDARAIEGIPDRMRRYLDMNSPAPGQMRVNDVLRPLIAFKPLNLLAPWPMKGKFDIIFCRNVVIYFDQETQAKLFNRFADIIADDGYLYIGHSESLFHVCDRFKAIGKTIHRKVK
jgi:chemotaxis protein methyltransferase CheR